MRFDKVILIGSGKIASDCLAYLTTLMKKENLMVMETTDSTLSFLKRICKKQEIPYITYSGGGTGVSKEIEHDILNLILGKRTLIISANNRFIFTPAIIHSPDTEIINFHYALLPNYRGMNIPTWVIYNGEKQTGITWHYVTEQIDHGKIIIQKVIDIDSTTTAFDITYKGMLLGIAAFKEFINKLLEGPVEGLSVQYPQNAIIYRNANLPMNGFLDLSQPMDMIIRLLHSYDYRGAAVIPKLKTEYMGKCYSVEKYEEHKVICQERAIEMKENILLIRENNREISLILQPI